MGFNSVFKGLSYCRPKPSKATSPGSAKTELETVLRIAVCRYLYHLSPYEIVDSLSPPKGKLKKIFSSQSRCYFIFYNNVYRVNVRCFLSTCYHKSLQNTKINGAKCRSRSTDSGARQLVITGRGSGKWHNHLIRYPGNLSSRSNTHTESRVTSKAQFRYF